MSIKNAIRRAYEYNKKVGRNKIYIAVDIHDTLAVSNYSNEMPPIIPAALNAIREICKFPEIVLILFSSSYDHSDYIDYFARYGLRFMYFNENPEVRDTKTGDFSKKFYYNVLLDDKAGFEVTDWLDVVDAITEYRVGFNTEPMKVTDELPEYSTYSIKD